MLEHLLEIRRHNESMLTLMRSGALRLRGGPRYFDGDRTPHAIEAAEHTIFEIDRQIAALEHRQ